MKGGEGVEGDERGEVVGLDAIFWHDRGSIAYDAVTTFALKLIIESNTFKSLFLERE